jgi:shikimate dehydrogenase
VAVRRLGDAPEGCDVLVSTIPAAAQGPEVLALAERATVVFDVVYDPWPTPLAAATAGSARVFVSGLDLLVHQAVLQVELMTGCSPAPLEAMHRAGAAVLAGRSG